MGELADRFERLFDELDGYSATVEHRHERALLWAAIAELEADLAHRTHGKWEDIGARFVDDRATLSDRLIAAEQRADALLAAVSKLVQGGNDTRRGIMTRCEHLELINPPAVPVSERTITVHGMRMTLATSGVAVPLLVAVYSPSAPPNPELLERASVELAEEYLRVKAEAEREQQASGVSVAESNAHVAAAGSAP